MNTMRVRTPTYWRDLLDLGIIVGAGILFGLKYLFDLMKGGAMTSTPQNEGTGEEAIPYGYAKLFLYVIFFALIGFGAIKMIPITRQAADRPLNMQGR